jgi:hypothetical protein
MNKTLVTFLTALIITVGLLTTQAYGIADSQTPDEKLENKQELIQEPQRYSDVEESAWFSPYIKELSEAGVVEGYADGRFGAWDPVNRAELAKMLVLLKAEIKGHWLKDNVTEIALVLATLLGWIYILMAFKKTTEVMTQQLIRLQRLERDPTSKGGNSRKAENNIEKNFKSNWWV